MELIYLSQRDAASAGLTLPDIIDVVERAFAQKASGAVEMPPKPGIHTRPDAFIHAMPAFLRGTDAAGVKWVSGYPENSARGLPYISGLFILNDPDTGVPLMVSDCTWITAMRTAAATAVSAKHLARPGACSVGILGCGVQGKANLEALSHVVPALDAVRVYDVRREAAERYVAEMEAKVEVDMEICAGPRAVVSASDIVVTAGPILKNPQPAIESDWLREGALACPLDFDSYWRSSAILAVDRFYTDDCDQLFYYREEGYFKTLPETIGELGDVIAGKSPGRESDAERIMAMNLGVALEDVAVGKKLYEVALERGIGTRLEM